MPTPAHSLYAFSGEIMGPTGPVEEWSFSLKTVDDNQDSSGIDLQPLANALQQTYVANVADHMPAWVRLTRCRYAAVGADGKYRTDIGGAYRMADWVGELNGLAPGRSKASISSALVVSLGTDRNGPTGKGRFFLPWPGYVIEDDFRIGEGNAQALATAMAEFVRDLNLIGGLVAVVSSKGYASPVRGVRVGRVPDSLRSRRRSLIEGYAESAVF